MDFKSFKKQKNNLKEAVKKVSEEENNKNNFQETYFPKLDKDGNAYAVIRFLPQPNTDKVAYQKMFKHKSQKTTAKYPLTMFCPTSFGKPYADCPLCAIAGAEYQRQKDAGIKQPTGIIEQRKPSTVINVLVIEDKLQPDKVGKVLPMFITTGILEMIDKKLYPKKRGDVQPESEIVYDLWEGRNFSIVIFKNSKGWNDYSDSEWASETSPVATTEKKIEEIFNQLHDLEKLYNNEENLLSPEKMIEKWDAFHSGGSTSIADKREALKKQEDKKENETQEEIEHDDNFSTNDTSSDNISSDENDDDVPW